MPRYHSTVTQVVSYFNGIGVGMVKNKAVVVVRERFFFFEK